MTAIAPIVGNPGTAFTAEHNREVLEQINTLVNKVNAMTGEGGTGDERIDAVEAILTPTVVSHFPDHDEKTWLTANKANHALTTTEYGHVPSGDEKTWLGANGTGVSVTAAQKAILAALQAGGNSFFVQLGAPVVADTDRIVAEVEWDDGTLTIAAQPDVPRNVTATLVDADNSTSGLLTITGTDIAGRVISETMAPNGAGGGKTLTGTKVFKTITSVVISGTAGSGVEDLLVVGVGNVIGVPVDLANVAEVVSTRLGGTLVVPTKATGTSTSGVNASASTYNGSKVLDVIIQMGLT